MADIDQHLHFFLIDLLFLLLHGYLQLICLSPANIINRI